jgi:GNAT superfamily N-acetyltransferase
MMDEPMISIRTSKEGDADSIARLVNIAFLAERFFIERDRTNPADIRAHMQKGKFLLAEEGPHLLGCIYYELRGERGYFGMLSVDLSYQGKGVGRQLVAAVEKIFRDAGCKFSDMKIVNVRTELHDIYTCWGYSETGTAVYDDPHPTKIPVHFVNMSKPLR